MLSKRWIPAIIAVGLLTGGCCCEKEGAAAVQDAQNKAGPALDAFHHAAAIADEKAYFGLFAPEGVFLGTDGTERWALKEFRDFAEPHFQGDSAWTFTPVTRNLDFSPGGEIAWFDEMLSSASYGDCRGTGVLRLIDGEWKIVQYSLTIPIPNALAKDFVAQIRAAGAVEGPLEK